MTDTAYTSGSGSASGAGFGGRVLGVLARAFAALSRAREAEAEMKTRQILRSLGIEYTPEKESDQTPRQ